MQAIGIGSISAFLVLVALAIPPIVTNTYAGMVGVDAETRDAAVGMGMSGGQVLRRVELPLALPLIMAGIRTSAVAVVATATLAALVGWGGLGRYIIDGSRVQDDERLFAGALLVALLAICVELLARARAAARRAQGSARDARDGVTSDVPSSRPPPKGPEPCGSPECGSPAARLQ